MSNVGLTVYKNNRYDERHTIAEAMKKACIVSCELNGAPLSGERMKMRVSAEEVLATVPRTCKACDGTGRYGRGDDVCPDCNGPGWIAT